MVSFWPWKGDDSSPASFEKALSSLSAKISKTSTRLDGLRQRSRRLHVLWTLYSGFAYLLSTVVLVLVVGWRNWGSAEYTGVVLGPGLIYLGRLLLSLYYDYRTSTVQASLDELERQRNQTIEKLKAATKYNSTQELLKKYGGSPTPKEKPTTKKLETQKTFPQQNATPQAGRTNTMPPPTANIPGRQLPPSPQGTPQQHYPSHPPPSSSSPTWPRPSSPSSPQADFAPNAFASPPQYAQPEEGGPRWYDRLMDVLLGEDESLPGKRLALICSSCRLVNGQAPPGVKTLQDVGKWKCMACGAMNGEENEVRRIVDSLKGEKPGKGREESQARRKLSKLSKHEGKDEEEVEEGGNVEGEESDITQYSSDDGEDGESEKMEEVKPKKEQDDINTPKRRSTRVRKKVDKDDD